MDLTVHCTRDIMDRMVQYRLENKTALVTGATSNIGRAIAVAFAAEGAHVVVAGRSQQRGAEVIGQIKAAGGRADFVAIDLDGTAATCDALAAEATRVLGGRIDILVNNAGGAFTPAERSKATQVPDEDTIAMFGVNYMSALYCCQEAAPAMRVRRSGVIVNVATMAALDASRTAARLVPYAVAKGAVLQYTRYLAAELGPEGIRVNCISPGAMLTARVKKQAAERGMHSDKEARRIPLQRFGEVEDCANVLEFLVTPLSGYVTGQCISVCGGAVLTPS
jgi:NAD(P)-dependent dehydrogenase (short-subunit alcohol dehydrogenase family)